MKGDSVVVAARAGNSQGATGSWSCDCGSTGSFALVIFGKAMFCEKAAKDPCKGSCEMVVSVDSAKTKIMAY